MQKFNFRFTVYFENPFWAGVYEKQEGKCLSVCKVTFGSEPKDYEVYEFLLKNWNKMIFSPPIKDGRILEQKRNPKRIQREINKQLSATGIGTKSQIALKQQQELKKTEHKKRTRLEKELQKEIQFSIRRQKKKDKHRGK